LIKYHEKLPQCQYRYKFPYESALGIKFTCDELSTTNSKFCIFHDKDHYAEHEREAAERFKEKVKESISKNKPLVCIGYYLPDINFVELLEGESFEVEFFPQRVYFSEATFYGEADFSKAKFSKEANFVGAIFSEKVGFWETKFSERAWFSKATFSETPIFSQTKFSERASFYQAAFSKEANFVGAIFSKEANFSKATFSKEASFFKTTFSGIVDFYQATFSEKVGFSSATFSEKVGFSSATFSKEASFYQAAFSKEANFVGAIFSKEANFSKATFYENVGFSKATFSETPIFSQTKFSERASFYQAAFSKDADFDGTTFSKEANFSKATFSKEANFSKATFSGIVDFSKAKFSKEANFVGANFSKEANFVEATFSETVSFCQAAFSKADFLGAKFLGETYFLKTNFTGESSFKYVLFEQPNKITFDDSCLSKVSFADSDITRLRFGDKITWGGKDKDKFTIIEEEWLRNKVKERTENEDWHEDVSLELVLSVYRNLRENYEFRLRYDDAGKFFIKEMELKRKYRDVPSISDFKFKLITLGRKLKGDQTSPPEVTYHLEENGWLRKHFSLTGLYSHLSRYGESIARPVLIGVITLFFSTIFWVTQSNPSLEPQISIFLGNSTSAIVPTDSSSPTTSTFVGFEEVGNVTHWLKASERSLADFLTLAPLGGDARVGVISFLIQVLGGALTFLLLAIALRRKFERKYTR
jgi:uncharacterized protein YjbI with pentapeptide repeats